MKKNTLLFLLIFALSGVQAQNYQISFAASGASTTVDSVTVENLTQCTDTTLAGSNILHLTSILVGINEVNTKADKTLQIYPNPNTGSCSFDFETTAQSITTIELFDITGINILYKQELLTKGYQAYSLSGMNSGVYFLRIESGDYSYTSKIVSSNFSNTNATIKHIETRQGTDKKTTVSNTEETINLKSGKSLINMQYTVGDRLKLTGKSGIYRTIFTLIPASSQTITFNFVACTDADSNHYAVLQIGTQLWMAENLKTTKYRNGTTIPNVTDPTIWIGLSTGAYCSYNNTTNTDTINTHGLLYNWHAVNTGILAPANWHVPTDAELTILADYLGGEPVAGGKMKEYCTTQWHSPNTGATNETGFTALPDGWRGGNYYGTFLDIGIHGYLSSSTEYSATSAWIRHLYCGYSNLGRGSNSKKNGLSVRCVKDF